MKITVRKLINKNLRMILIIAAATAIALGILLVLISGNEERNQVPTAPTVAGETKATEPTKEIKIEAEKPEVEQIPLEEGLSKAAQNLFNARVEQMDDSAAVAQLLETIDLRNNIADYRVRLEEKKGVKRMTITFETTITAKGKNSFDEKVRPYAEQILALIGDINEVRWTCEIQDAGDGEKEPVTVLNEAQATKRLGKNIKDYGKSAKAVQELLSTQSGGQAEEGSIPEQGLVKK